ADTPYGAWAEFLRHEEITDPVDLPTIHRQMWSVDIGDAAAQPVKLPWAILVGGRETYARCQQAARDLRERAVRRIVVPSAALKRGGASGVRVDDGMQPGEARDGATIVIFGAAPELVGWVAAAGAHPPADLLDRVRH